MSISAKTRSARRRNWTVALSALAATLVVSSPLLADAGAALPPGPKESLALFAGDDAAMLAGLLGKTLETEGWIGELSAIAEDEARRALAEYLALNLPLAAPVEGAVATVLAALPLDGKELFVQNCLSCHGGDRYFLQQGRTDEEWMGIFDAPYHRRLLTEGVERETFASYAAATTPLKLENVPEALQDK